EQPADDPPGDDRRRPFTGPRRRRLEAGDREDPLREPGLQALRPVDHRPRRPGDASKPHPRRDLPYYGRGRRLGDEETIRRRGRSGGRSGPHRRQPGALTETAGDGRRRGGAEGIVGTADTGHGPGLSAVLGEPPTTEEPGGRGRRLAPNGVGPAGTGPDP